MNEFEMAKEIQTQMAAVSPAPVRSSPDNPPPAFAQEQSLLAEFETLNKKRDALLLEFMRPYNRRDTASLEALKKQVESQDTVLLSEMQTALGEIQTALSAVEQNASIQTKDLTKKKKPTENERALLAIKLARDRNIAAAQKSASSQTKSSYDSLLRRAIAAKQLEFADDIRTQMSAFTPLLSSLEGKWQENFAGHKDFILNKNGGAWRRYLDTGRSGWRQISPGVFSITLVGGPFRGWEDGTIWKISSDGKTLRRTDDHKNWTLSRK
jgi:hypothetical protein